ncbi:MAG TPA: hypothetical protein VK524_12805 [Polyangiaceae bacterium]|nr:hypothetical protein [Polyangiaceae bacterium]
MLAAACSLVIDSDRTFADDAGLDATNPGSGGSNSGSDSSFECAPGCRGKLPFHCENTAEVVAANPCPDVCFKGDCVACVPDTYHCSSVTQLDKCNPLGQWAAETQCQLSGAAPGAKWCVADACVNNEEPELYIDKPDNDETLIVFAPNRLATLKLEGRAFDENRTEDLSGSIEWHAARVDEPDGQKWVGSGASVFNVQLENIRGCEQVGTAYDISATVVDRAGFVQRQTVRIRIRNDQVCPSG